jgi:ADP-ribose pyrophosphatase YjhB (NUDIX family)
MNYRFCMECGGRLRRVREEGLVRRRCRRCGWTFYGNPIPATIALIVRGGKVLLARRGAEPYRGTWDLPGGFVEAGETPERGLVREIREELGARIRSARFLAFSTETYGPGGFPILAVVFRVRLARGRLRRGSDVSELRWFPRRSLPYRQIGFPSVRQALRLFA